MGVQEKQAEKYAQQMELFQDPLIEGWTVEGILTEIALKHGLSLGFLIEVGAQRVLRCAPTIDAARCAPTMDIARRALTKTEELFRIKICLNAIIAVPSVCLDTITPNQAHISSPSAATIARKYLVKSLPEKCN